MVLVLEQSPGFNQYHISKLCIIIVSSLKQNALTCECTWLQKQRDDGKYLRKKKFSKKHFRDLSDDSILFTEENAEVHLPIIAMMVKTHDRKNLPPR